MNTPIEIMDELEKSAKKKSICKKRKVASVVVIESEHGLCSLINWPVGYSGPPLVLGECQECKRINSPSSSDLSSCPSLHAEHIAIVRCVSKFGSNLIKFVLFTTYFPCPMCFALIVESNIRTVYYREDNSEEVMRGIIKIANKLNISLIKV